MARGVNKAILVGNVCGDPELREMNNGNKVCNFSLATNEQWKDKATGEKKDKVEYHRIVVFGRLAEIAGDYVRKGSQVYIEGKLQTREWEKDGVKRYTTEILVDISGTLQLLGGKPEGGARNASAPQPKQAHQPSGGGDIDDDIPFSRMHYMEGM